MPVTRYCLDCGEAFQDSPSSSLRRCWLCRGRRWDERHPEEAAKLRVRAERLRLEHERMRAYSPELSDESDS